MSFPNMSPAPYYSYVPPAVPKAYVFNGTDEGIQRTLSTSAPGTLRFTYSMWVKPIAWTAGSPNFLTTFIVINGAGTSYILGNVSDSGNFYGIDQVGSPAFNNYATALTPDIHLSAWTHLLFRVDTSQAAVADRIRLYRNGTQSPDDADTEPALNAAHFLFSNTFTHDIGWDSDSGDFSNCKLAFIDVIDGLSLPPTDFAFDNAGTWTRKKYSGSYGTYGFCLDGTDGFNDVSGNSQHFNPFNMDASNITNADMPPFTN